MNSGRRVAAILALTLLVSISLAIAYAAIPSWAKKGNYAVYTATMEISGDAVKKAYNTDKIRVSMKVKVTITDVDDEGVSVKYSISDLKVEPKSAEQFKNRLTSLMTSTDKLYFDEEFELGELKTYVNPATLPSEAKNGVYTVEKNGITYKVVYDTKTGWLKEAHMSGDIGGAKASMDVKLVKSNFIGASSTSSSGTASKTLIAIIAIVIIVAAIVAAKKLTHK